MRNLGWECQHTILQIKSNGLLKHMVTKWVTVKHSVGACCEHYCLLNETGRKKTPGRDRKILRLTNTFFKHLFIFYGYEHLPICMYSGPPSARGGQKKVLGPLEVTLLVGCEPPGGY